MPARTDLELGPHVWEGPSAMTHRPALHEHLAWQRSGTVQFGSLGGHNAGAFLD
jgi:hypothetical protein